MEVKDQGFPSPRQRIVLIILLIIMSGSIVFKLWKNGTFIFIPTAEVNSDSVTWNGRRYVPISGKYSEGRTIAKAKNGDRVYAVVEDPSHTFIVGRSFLDQYLFVSADYIVPKSGELTTVSWNGTYIADAIFLDAVSKIVADKTTTFIYKTEDITPVNEDQHLRSIYFAYENCPVTTHFKGYMGKVNGEWVITTSVSQNAKNEDGARRTYFVGCYKIPSEYWDVLTEYFS